jgi:hypothetical protein
VLDEKVDSVRLELGMNERAFDVELSLDESDGLAHTLQSHPMLAADSSEDERLDQMGEGEKTWPRPR